MKWIRMCAIALCATVAASPALAVITTSVTANSTTGVGAFLLWPMPPTLASPPTFNAASVPGPYSVSENNYGGASLFSLSQSFTPATSGNLTNVQITISGTAPVSFNVALYDALALDVTDVGAGTYTPGSNVSNNLFADTAVQTWNGYTLQGANAAVLNFALSGGDQVPLTANKSYIFEISSSTNLSNMVWFRNGDNAIQYQGGQAYRQRSPLNGNAARDMAIAINMTPEPASWALAGMAGLLVALRRRLS